MWWPSGFSFLQWISFMVLKLRVQNYFYFQLLLLLKYSLRVQIPDVFSVGRIWIFLFHLWVEEKKKIKKLEGRQVKNMVTMSSKTGLKSRSWHFLVFFFLIKITEESVKTHFVIQNRLWFRTYPKMKSQISYIRILDLRSSFQGCQFQYSFFSGVSHESHGRHKWVNGLFF